MPPRSPEKRVFDNAAFYSALDAARRSRGLNWKEAAAEAEISQSTLTRMAQGKRPDVDSLGALSRWAGLDAGQFMRGRDGAREVEPPPLAQVSSRLRSDPNLTADAANTLDAMLQAAYDQLKRTDS
jgi:transcriptional regulator with XRE-family HTH domain